jgi:N-acetylglutamate synthase-like GNAT family acetyltransferase
MVEGAVLERILVVVCTRLGRMEHCHMAVGMVAVAVLEADVMLVDSLVIAGDMAGGVAQDHNVRSGS